MSENLSLKESESIRKFVEEYNLTEESFRLQFTDRLSNMSMNPDDKYRAELYTNLMCIARYFNVEEQARETADKWAIENKVPMFWETPKSFESSVSLPPFPMQSLPPLLHDYLKAVSDFVQVVPEMAVLPLLSVLSLCVQGKAVIKHTGNSHTEPLNLYTITVASPGERKSGSLKEFMRPVEEFQEHYNKIHATEIEEYKTERAFLENQRQSALKGKNADLDKAKEIAKQITELEEKHELILNVSDVTPEALAWEMYLQGDRMGIIDSEGSVFDVLSGIYTGGKANINIFLESYDGSPYTIIRRTKESIKLENPLLTMGLMVQPDHFQEAMNNKQFSGRGFIHRFLFSFPESKAGYLSVSSPDIPISLQSQYKDLINRLLRMPESDSLPVIQCDREAELLFSNYYEDLQKKMRNGGIFENLKEWTSKQFARALRIAGILHLCEHEPSELLSGDTAMKAVNISMWTENNALNALSGSASEPPEIKNAKYMLDRLKKSKLDSLSKRELLRHCQKLNASECEAPLETLEDMNIIRREFAKDGAGRPKETIKINPLIYCK